MTLAVNLFEGDKNVTDKRENLHTSVVLVTLTPMLKSKSERMWKLEFENRIQVPHMKSL